MGHHQAQEFFHNPNNKQWPQCSVPPIPPLHASYNSTHVVGGIKPTPKSMEEGEGHLPHSSSQSFLGEEQPLWLDELLNEPEILPLRKGHRRSSSDSFAYTNAARQAFNIAEQCEFKNIVGPPRGLQYFDHFTDLQRPPSKIESCPSNEQHKLNKEPDGMQSTITEKQRAVESSSLNLEGSSGNSDGRSSGSRTDAKRAKRQSAHRSRARKLQYMAELEIYVQVLQQEGFQVSAELEFVDQQNVLLGMENTALKQQLDSLTQEQHLKFLERDLLEREVLRLQTMCQHQQQRQNIALPGAKNQAFSPI